MFRLDRGRPGSPVARAVLAHWAAVGKASRTKAERRRAPVPPVGKSRPGLDRRLLVGGAVVAVLIVAGVVAAVVAFAGGGSGSQPKTVAESSLAGLQAGPAPWSANTDQLRERLQTLGLPALTQEGTVLHIHQHLDLFVDGKKQPVPMAIGIKDSEFISTIHTHDPTGVIHVESPTQEDFTLGQFFGVWGVRLTRSAVGGYRSYALYVNGKRYQGDPTTLKLREHQELALVVGKAPAKIPARYAFPAGE